MKGKSSKIKRKNGWFTQSCYQNSIDQGGDERKQKFSQRKKYWADKKKNKPHKKNESQNTKHFPFYGIYRQ